MKPPRATLLALGSVLAATSAAAQAQYVFTFSGTILEGSDTSTATDLANSAFTFQMFVEDTAADLTPTLGTASYAISSMTLDIGSDGSIERTINSGFSANNAVYIDPGTTQLVGGQDLFGTDTTFAFGVFLPDGAFADVKNLAGQSAFSLNNLNSSSFSFLNSGDFALSSLGLDSFTFAIVPLPTPVAMTGLGLIAAGLVARRRAKRLG